MLTNMSREKIQVTRSNDNQESSVRNGLLIGLSGIAGFAASVGLLRTADFMEHSAVPDADTEFILRSFGILAGLAMIGVTIVGVKTAGRATEGLGPMERPDGRPHDPPRGHREPLNLVG